MQQFSSYCHSPAHLCQCAIFSLYNTVQCHQQAVVRKYTARPPSQMGKISIWLSQQRLLLGSKLPGFSEVGSPSFSAVTASLGLCESESIFRIRILSCRIRIRIRILPATSNPNLSNPNPRLSNPNPNPGVSNPNPNPGILASRIQIRVPFKILLIAGQFWNLAKELIQAEPLA